MSSLERIVSSRQVTSSLLRALPLLAAFAELSLGQNNSTHQLTVNKETNTDLVQMWQEVKDKDPAGWATSILDAQEKLATFGYGTTFTAKLDEQTKEALRRLQKRNGLPTTGELNYNTWMRIQDDNLALKPEIPIGPQYMFNDSDWSGTFTAEGIWLEQGRDPEAKTPVRSSRIECFKAWQMCVVATSTGTLIHLQYMQIERWDEYEIVTHPDDLPC